MLSWFTCKPVTLQYKRNLRYSKNYWSEYAKRLINIFKARFFIEKQLQKRYIRSRLIATAEDCSKKLRLKL